LIILTDMSGTFPFGISRARASGSHKSSGLIRGGHYGQRSCEPQLKAEHKAAPTKPAT
jgi:hypothetical protein